MPWIETRMLKDPWDVDRRLAELALTRAGLLAVRDVALGEAANATPHHCANAWGTFSYQQGTWALRDQFVGPRWAVDRAEGVEAILARILTYALRSVTWMWPAMTRPSRNPGLIRAAALNVFAKATFSAIYLVSPLSGPSGARLSTSWLRRTGRANFPAPPSRTEPSPITSSESSFLTGATSTSKGHHSMMTTL